jgi:hypothetical protein
LAKLRYWLPPSDRALEIQMSVDGETWVTVSVVDPSEDWRLVSFDLSELGEKAIYVRVVASTS